MAMTSSRPYMLRAIYDWIVDNNCTPHILVVANAPGVEVPQQYVNKDGQIVLNIAPGAVAQLLMDQHRVSFSARFGGVPMSLSVPVGAILGIYARENGQGMMFEFEQTEPPEPPAPSQSPAPGAKAPGSRPSLKVVK